MGTCSTQHNTRVLHPTINRPRPLALRLLTRTGPPHLHRRLSINLGFEICKTDLLEYVLSRGKLSEVETRTWVQQLVSAVAHLHACDVVHLDIKLENLFIDSSNMLKVGDLGLAAVAPAGTTTYKMCGSGVYAAPEVLLCKDFGGYDGRAADVWSIGVCAFVMARGRFPFHVNHQTKGFAVSMEAARFARASGGPLRVPPPVLSSASQRDSLSPPLLAMLDSCINLEASFRPSADELSCDPWMLAHDDDSNDEPEALEVASCLAAAPPKDAPTEPKGAEPAEGRPPSCPRTPSPAIHLDDRQRHSTPPNSPGLRRRWLSAHAAAEVALAKTVESANAKSNPTPHKISRRSHPTARATPYTRAGKAKQSK